MSQRSLGPNREPGLQNWKRKLVRLDQRERKLSVEKGRPGPGAQLELPLHPSPGCPDDSVLPRTHFSWWPFRHCRRWRAFMETSRMKTLVRTTIKVHITLNNMLVKGWDLGSGCLSSDAVLDL